MNPVGKRREQQKAETHEIILESARILFETVGFEKTTMRAVATNAGIGLGTIYKHFNNKAALLTAALLGDLTRLYNSATSAIRENIPLKQQFLSISGQFYTYYTARPALARAYLTNLLALDEQGMAQINAFDEAYADKIRFLVEQAQERGEISTEKNSNYVALSIIADYFFVLVTFFLRYGETDPERMLGVLEQLLEQTVA